MKRLSHGRRGSDLPMRVRRRQSDAKWRANVASCYETLKLIIPMNKRASKRQISKALILQETSKHINFLEHILETLLIEKGHIAGNDDIEPWVVDQVSAVKTEFVDTQKEKIAALNTERRYKRSRYKLMIADHLLTTGSVAEPPSNASCATPQGNIIGTVTEQRSVVESEHVVPEQPFPLLGNEAPGSYEASYRQYLEQQALDPARSTTTLMVATEADNDVVYNLQLVPEVDTRGTPMYKVTTRREKVPTLIKRSANVKIAANQRVPSAATSRCKLRDSSDSLGIGTTVRQQVALNRVKRVLDMDDGISGSKKKRTLKRNRINSDTLAPCDFTPVKNKQAATATASFSPVELPFMSWQLTPTSVGPSWMTDGSQMVPASPTIDNQPCNADTDRSLLCMEPMWMSSDEESAQEEDIDPCRMNEKTPVTSRSRRGRGKQTKKRRPAPNDDPDFEVGSSRKKGQRSREQPRRSSKTRKVDSRRRPRCRRSLEPSFSGTDYESMSALLDGLPTQVPQLTSGLDLGDSDLANSDNIRSPGVFSTNQIDTKDFDGYLMFYKQKLHQMEQQSLGGSADLHGDDLTLSKAVYESWRDLSDDQRQTMITLAVTETASSRHSDDGRLSDDLLGVDIQPMCKLEKFPIDGKKGIDHAQSQLWPLPYDTDLESGHMDGLPTLSHKSPSPLLSAGSSHMDQDVPSMPFSALAAGYGDDDDAPCQVCPTNDHFQPVTETMTGTDIDDDMDCVKPLLVLTDKMAVSSLWCTTDEPLESFEYIGQFSPLLGHKLELFQ